MSRIGSELSREQTEAVEHGDGPLLVLAGAGTGKTRVITHRVARLIEKGAPPHRILAITFTNKAAGEMRERITGLVGTGDVWVHTFHVFAVRLLRQDIDALGRSKGFTIFDQEDRASLLKQTCKLVDVDLERWTVSDIGAAISRAKNSIITAADYAHSAMGMFEERVSEVYQRYQRLLESQEGVDFDDLLLLSVQLLQRSEEVRRRWAERFLHVLVDEYQDTNRPQYEMVRALGAERRNVCATGDPDQSIYRWRGADLGNILRFEEDFPGARVVKLERNYRSTKCILLAASSLIAHNRKRKEKTLFTDNPEGELVTLSLFGDDRDEARAVVSAIRKGVNRQRCLSDHAVFFRTNAMSRTLEAALLEQGIPYVLVGGVEFYQRREIKDILAYLRALANPSDGVSLARIVNVPRRGIGQKTLAILQGYAESRPAPLFRALLDCDVVPGLTEARRRPLRELRELFRDLALEPTTPVAPLVREIVARVGYERHLQKSEAYDTQDRIENVRELVSAALQYDLSREEGDLAGFLEEVALATSLDRVEEGADRVTLMTVHAAKGLEFKVVFVVGLEEGMFPHSRSQDTDDDVEEERRLLHVAMTRAREELHLSRCQQRHLMGEPRWNPPSRFLTEIEPASLQTVGSAKVGFGRRSEEYPADPVYDLDPDVPDAAEADVEPPVATPRFDTDLQVGDEVRHPFFGPGVIQELRGEGKDARVRIRFRGGDERQFVLEYARLVRTCRSSEEP
jgi:DNA helicase-2/ATP-dependent DNA helicase PcrA